MINFVHYRAMFVFLLFTNYLLSIYIGSMMLRTNMLSNGNDYSGLVLILPSSLLSIGWVLYDHYVVAKLGMKFKPIIGNNP